MPRSLVVVFTLLVAIGAVGCGPRGYRECMNEAAGKPTERGVAVAAGQCAKQFPEEYAEQRAQGGGYSPADKPVAPGQ